jgi:uncharacterized membrane-anchored protein
MGWDGTYNILLSLYPAQPTTDLSLLILDDSLLILTLMRARCRCIMLFILCAQLVTKWSLFAMGTVTIFTIQSLSYFANRKKIEKVFSFLIILTTTYTTLFLNLNYLTYLT